MRIETFALRAFAASLVVASSMHTSARAEVRASWLGATLPFSVRAAAARGSEIVVVGEHGAFATTEGEGFRISTLPSVSSATAMWVSNEGDIFVVNESGELLVRAQDSAWRTFASGCGKLRAVAGRSRTDVLVGGDAGCLKRFDGRTFTDAVPETSLAVFRIVVDGSRALIGGIRDADEDVPVWFELRGGAMSTIALPEDLDPVVALLPRGARGLLVASARVVLGDGRSFLNEYDGPRAPRAFFHAGASTYVATEDGLHRLDGQRWVRQPYFGHTLLAITPRGNTFEGVTEAGERVHIDGSSTTTMGGVAFGASWLCPTPEGLFAFGEDAGLWVFGEDGVAWRTVSRPSACTPPREDAGRSLRFVRGDETYAWHRDHAERGIVRTAGGIESVLADRWAVARFPGDIGVLGGVSTPEGDVFAGGTGFFVRFAAGRVSRHILGSTHGVLSPGVIREVAGTVRAWGDGSAIARWDGSKFRTDITLFERVLDVIEDRDRVLALGVPVGADRSEGYDEDRFGTDGASERAESTQIAVRRASGYFASLDSAGDLASGLEGLELGPVSHAYGRAPNDVWAHTALGLAHFDGTRWTRVSTYEPQPIVALAGAGGKSVAVGATGRVLSLDDPDLHAERDGVRSRAVSAFVDATGTVYVGGVGFIAERGANGWTRTWTAPMENEIDGRFGSESYPGSPDWLATIAGFARIAGQVHAITVSGDWLVREASSWTTGTRPKVDFPRVPATNDYADPTIASVCAVLAPREGQVVVVSCDTGMLAVLEGDAIRYEPLPGRTRVTSAACIDGDACYFFHRAGAFRVDAASF